MDRAAEEKALADLQARLEEDFPNVHPDVIAAAIGLAHSKLDGPVRDFVPVLVERAARDRLSFALREGSVAEFADTSNPPGEDA